MITGKTAKALRLSLGILVTLAFSWLAFGKLDWHQAQIAVGDAKWSWIGLAVLCLAADYSLRVVRWWLMLRKLTPSVRLSQCFGPFLSSIALNNVLPFRAGDVVRTVGFCRQLNVPALKVLGTMVIERLFDLVSILIIFLIGFQGAAGDILPKSLIVVTWVVIGLCVSLLAGILLAPEAIRRIASRRSHRSEGSPSRFWSRVEQFLESLVLLRSPRLAAGLTVLSLLAWVFEGAVFACTAQAIAIESSTIAPWFSMTSGTLATLIPSTPGYVGTFDYSAALGLQAYGASANAAGVFALLVHVVLWLPLTATGLAALALPTGRQLLRSRVSAPAG